MTTGTVPTEVSQVDFTGNGVTTLFPIPFPIQAKRELVVTLLLFDGIVADLQTLGTHYTINEEPSDGPVVTMLTAPPDFSTLHVERTVPITQDVNLVTQGPMSPATFTQMYSKRTMVEQQLARRIAMLESTASPTAVVLAGAGLSKSGDTVNVGGGAGILVNPVNIEIDYSGVNPLDVLVQTASTGVSDYPARSDHKHNVTTAAAGTASIGDAAAAGTATSVARSDHKHAFTAPAAPANVTKAAASAGAATTFARSDHKHDLTTAAPVTITTANAEGTATSAARSDHAHDHGALLGGDRHALAVAGVSHGFLDKADKTKLDGLASETITQGGVHTTDATPTTVISFTPADESVEMVEVVLGMIKSTGASGGVWKITGGFRRDDGNTVQIGATSTGIAVEDDAGAPTVAFSIASPAVNVVVTGVAATVLTWKAVARRVVTIP